jgi:hypothetical protein
MYDANKLNRAKINGFDYIEINRLILELNLSIGYVKKICIDNAIKYYKKEWDFYILYSDFNLFTEFLFKPLWEYMSELQELNIETLHCNFESNISEYLFTEDEIHILNKFYEMCLQYNCFGYSYQLASINTRNVFKKDEIVQEYNSAKFKVLLNKCVDNINCPYVIKKDGIKFVINVKENVSRETEIEKE